MTLVSSNRGFSLLELMIVVAISGVLMLGIMSIMEYQSKVSRTAEINRQVDDIKRQIQVWISTQTMCDLTFGGTKQGEKLVGIRLKNDGTADDYILKTGDRFPGSNWAITMMEVLNSTDMILLFPNFKPIVGDGGVGVAVLRVRMAQLSGATGNTLMTEANNPGSFTTMEKKVYFPISAVFGSPEPISVPDCSSLDTGRKNADGGHCCDDCAIPGANMNWATYIQNQTGVAVSASNPAKFKSSFDAGKADQGCTQVMQDGVPMYQGMCHVYNINLPIMNCLSAVVDPMSPYK